MRLLPCNQIFKNCGRHVELYQSFVGMVLLSSSTRGMGWNFLRVVAGDTRQFDAVCLGNCVKVCLVLVSGRYNTLPLGTA